MATQNLPTDQAHVDVAILRKNADLMMAEYGSWNKKYDKAGIEVYVKKDVFPGVTSLKYTTTFQANLERVEAVMYRELLAHMPEWSAEFQSGDVLRGSLQEDECIMHTRFKTPFFMGNRDYVYQFNRLVVDGVYYYFYHSVQFDGAAPTNDYVRGLLINTVYRFKPTDDGQYSMTHILTTELGGSMPSWFQNSGAVVNGMVTANVRDCKSLVKLMHHSD